MTMTVAERSYSVLHVLYVVSGAFSLRHACLASVIFDGWTEAAFIWPHMIIDPVVDSASNRNEYQEYLLGG